MSEGKIKEGGTKGRREGGRRYNTYMFFLVSSFMFLFFLFIVLI